MENMENIIISTTDIDTPYEPIGTIQFKVSNKGLFGGRLRLYINKYRLEAKKMKKAGTLPEYYSEWFAAQTSYEQAQFIATEECKKCARQAGADAVIHVVQETDEGVSSFGFFSLQMYGTAVKYTSEY